MKPAELQSMDSCKTLRMEMGAIHMDLFSTVIFWSLFEAVCTK